VKQGAFLPIVGAGLIAGVGMALAAAAPGFAPVEVRVQPFGTFEVGPGSSVEFRGGLVLSSPNRAFGSWSGLDFSTDGQTLYAIADDGQWLSLHLVESGGLLIGVDAAKMAPFLDDNGAVITRKVAVDAEGLRIVRRGGVDTAFVSFEQVPDVRIYAGPDFATAKPRHMSLPKVLDAAPDNQGLEAIAVAPQDGPLGGAVVVIAEHFLDKAGNHRGFILDGPRPGGFTLKRGGDFDVSDAAFMPNGDLLVLERKFVFPTGFAMRIRRIAAASITPGAVLDGPVLLAANAGNGIDNMEGMAIRADASGGALVTLISDDNHNFLERTILLDFAVNAAPASKPRLRADEAALQ
jgi:hypothetical protein